MIRKYIIVADDSIKGFDEEIARLEREWGAEEIRWIPVSERAAEFPCLACDIFKQIFIPSQIVVLNNRCYDGKDFDFNVEKFLKGKEITTYGGEKLYVKPREITAWMPLPEPYQSND